ncbi:outer membrane lipid asymmetry maintenance protein MlaD, partial [Burkholderia pseudomallei]
AGLLGEQYIGLDPGGDTEMLKAGDTSTMTQSAIVLENLIGQFLYSKAAAAGGAKPGAAASGAPAPAPVAASAASAASGAAAQ